MTTTFFPEESAPYIEAARRLNATTAAENGALVTAKVEAFTSFSTPPTDTYRAWVDGFTTIAPPITPPDPMYPLISVFVAPSIRKAGSLPPPHWPLHQTR